MVKDKAETCHWCGTETATETFNCWDKPVYCEGCQRMLLRKYGINGALEEWESTRIRWGSSIKNIKDR